MDNHNNILIVSGLPRSGTSLMMQMLEVGGISILSDGIRQADANNAKGYYELEAVKNLETDYAWLYDAHGKAVKVISHLLRKLPPSFEYRIILMQRPLDIIVRSQNKMLKNLNKESGNLSDQQLVQLYELHLEQTIAWMEQQDNVRSLKIQYEDLLTDTDEQIKKIDSFLDLDLNKYAMREIVDKTLNHTKE